MQKDTSTDKLEIIPLGAGMEVGRSAVIVKFKGKTVMFDCGIHPAYTGYNSLPFFDFIDPSTVDLVLVSHFHLDHCGAVPYFLEKTNFHGKCYMTYPTKAIYKLIMSDFIHVSKQDDLLFSDQDLVKSLDKIEHIDYHQEMEYNGIKFWCYNAGHVLGAAMFMIDIGVKILYTGDFSRQPDRHLLGAETPLVNPDVLIVESTYGIMVHEPRKEREQRFTKMVDEVVSRGGRCLLPVFALGRAQELLLILDEYWSAHPRLQKIPIYYASALARKSMHVFRTYINMMNDKIKKQFDISNPFDFQYIFNLKNVEEFQDTGPMVVMASPGMLQTGFSLELFEKWCTDPKNGIVIPGYCVEGTLAKKIMTEPSEVTLSSGQTVPLKMSVKTISFSAHSDRQQTEDFITAIRPQHVVLVHGDSIAMTRLKNALQTSFDKLNVYTPKNCHPVEILFREEKIVKIVGTLGTTLTHQQPTGPSALTGDMVNAMDGQYFKGILLQKDFKNLLLKKEDLPKYSDVNFNGIKQKLVIPLPSYDYVKILSGLFKVNIHSTDNYQSVTVLDAVDVKQPVKNITGTATTVSAVDDVIIEWHSSATNDLIADKVLQVMTMSSEEAGSEIYQHSATEATLMYAVTEMLRERFSNVELDMKTLQVVITLVPESSSLEKKALITKNGQLICDDKELAKDISAVLRRIFMSLFPMPSCYDEVTCQDMYIDLGNH